MSSKKKRRQVKTRKAGEGEEKKGKCDSRKLIYFSVLQRALKESDLRSFRNFLSASNKRK